MKSKIKGKPTKIVSPYGESVHKTERSAVAVLMHWMREIIEKRSLDLGLPDVDTSGDDRKQPDTVIYESSGSQKALCIIEAKPPYYDSFDEKELKEPARQKATHRKAKYFVTTNFKRFIWFNTEKVNSLKPEEEQVIERYNFSEIESLDEIEQSRYRDPIKKGLEDFLLRLHAVHTGKEPEPQLAIDDYLIFRLQEKIRILSKYYMRIIDDQCHKDSAFATKVKNWFIDQGWNFTWQPQDFDKAARQTAYLLVNKILFYDLLQAKRPQDFDKLDLSESLTKGELLKSTLQGYFNQVLRLDYETIYTTDFIDTIAFPEAKEVVKEIKELISILKRYDLSAIGYDIIGGIFERLIPQDERHNLGQYFTSPDIVDLILKFCLHHEEDKVLDPACGAGTFLVRAYKHKQAMNLRLNHETLLETLWGDDIAKFPAHLSTINLAINDLRVEKNYPNIIQEDFFAIMSPTDGGFELPEKWRRVRAKTLGIEARYVVFPRWFDIIIGNPPYTRQEEIPEIGVNKGNLIENALRDPSGNKTADIGRRAGIHAYFFVHGTKFLRDGGYFGFIVSNSWLDTDYGKGLQEFFLRNYKILAIIESKVERWFEEADINTCIVILQKCNDAIERNNNSVRFVFLKKPLRHFIPPAQDMWDKQIDRLNEIEKFKKTILAHSDFYENDEFRIYPKIQKELYDEGFDSEKNKYVGAKWGKYLRAPDIFFEILSLAKDKLTTLSNVADVETYLNTGGADGFFIVRPSIHNKHIIKIANPSHEGANKKFDIENKYAKPFIKSPRDLYKIMVDRNDAAWLLICPPTEKNKVGDLVKKYIKWGETKGFHLRSGRKNRDPWWSLPPQAGNPGILLWSRIHDDTHIAFYNPHRIANTNFYFIWPKELSPEVVVVLLNSTFYALIKEFLGRVNFGGGALKTEGSDLSKFLFLKKDIIDKYETQLKMIFESLSQRKINTIFEELGLPKPNKEYSNISIASISLDKVAKDRLELDKIICCQMLGLPEQKIIELYKATVDLVLSRLARAQSGRKKKRTKEGIDIDAFIITVMTQIGTETIGKFYREHIINSKQIMVKTLPKLSSEIKIDRDLLGWKLCSGKKYVECRSEHEARYLKVFLEAGQEKIKVPKDDRFLRVILPTLIESKKKIDAIIDSYLESIVESKTKEKLKHLLWQEIMNR